MNHELQSVTWSVHRLRESPGKSVVVGVFLAVCLVFSWFAFGPGLSLVALLVFALALNTWYLPTTCTFDRDGITVDKRLFSHTYPWDQFRRFFRTTGGVVVSPFSRRTFLDTFRGVHLLLPEDPQPVLDYLERYFAARRARLDAELSGETGSDGARLDTQEARDSMDDEVSNDETETVETT